MTKKKGTRKSNCAINFKYLCLSACIEVFTINIFLFEKSNLDILFFKIIIIPLGINTIIFRKI